jgi:hypothetical protein
MNASTLSEAIWTSTSVSCPASDWSLGVIGLLVLFLLGLHIRFALFLAQSPGAKRWTHGRSLRVFAVFLGFAALPFGDELVGRTQFYFDCKSMPGPVFYPALDSARTIRWDFAKTRKSTRAAFIPVEQVTSVAVDADTGAIVFEHSALFTPGGWVMRAGLNMGDTSTCNQVNSSSLFEQRGFVMAGDGRFARKVVE